MCVTPRMPDTASAAPAIIPANRVDTSTQEAELEARMRRARSSAAANVLTSARGIPQRRGSTPQLGRPA